MSRGRIAGLHPNPSLTKPMIPSFLMSCSIHTMLGVILSDHIPGDLNLTLTLTANSN